MFTAEKEIRGGLAQINLVEHFVENIVREFNLYSTLQGSLTIATLEAFKCAVLRGNNADANKVVKLKCTANADEVVISVFDESHQCDYAAAFAQADLHAENSGLYLIKTLSDGVEMADGGAGFIMTFHAPVLENNHRLSNERMRVLNRVMNGKEQQQITTQHANVVLEVE